MKGLGGSHMLSKKVGMEVNTLRNKEERFKCWRPSRRGILARAM